MAALTSQDYKAQRHGTRDARRLKDFGYGTACGAVLAGIACAWLGTRAHATAAPTAAQQAPRVAGAAAASPGCAEPLTFPKRMTGHDLDVPLPPRNPGQDAAAKNGQGR